MAEKRKRVRHRDKKYKVKMNRLSLIITLLLLIVIAIGCIIHIIYENEYTTIDLFERTEIAFQGYDSEGILNIDLKPDPMFQSFFDTVHWTLDKDSHLSNGDKINLIFEYDENVAKNKKIKIKNKENEILVDNLSSPKKLSMDDIFDSCCVTIKGIVPLIEVDIENISSDSFLKTIQFNLKEQETNYKLSDDVIIVANVNKEEALLQGYELENDKSIYEKKYTIDGLDSYIIHDSEITSETIKIMDQYAQKLFGDATDYGLRIFSEADLMPIWINNKTTFIWSSPRLISAYMDVLKEEKQRQSISHQNDIKLVYTATLQQADGVSCSAEVVVQFTDLIIQADGKIDLNLNSGKIIAASYKDKNIKQLLDGTYDDSYRSVKLDINSL